MLKIKVELHPFGVSSWAKEIATVDLWNEYPNGSVGGCDYRAKLKGVNQHGDPIDAEALVVGHDREEPLWNLLHKTFDKGNFF